MADVNTGGEEGGKKGKHSKKRAKKSSTRIDMTPMVDLAFLLLTFFMLTTTFSKPKTMEINMPFDDVKKEAYKDIKDEVVMIYEQGRHHDTSIIVIDQYIKSKKVPPEIRETSSHLIFRNFDETIKKEINDICAFDKSSLDINTIKDLINNYYSIIIDFNNKQKLFYFKSPSIIFS